MKQLIAILMLSSAFNAQVASASLRSYETVISYGSNVWPAMKCEMIQNGKHVNDLVLGPLKPYFRILSAAKTFVPQSVLETIGYGVWIGEALGYANPGDAEPQVIGYMVEFVRANKDESFPRQGFPEATVFNEQFILSKDETVTLEANDATVKLQLNCKLQKIAYCDEQSICE